VSARLVSPLVSRTLIIIGLGIAAVGLLWPWIARLGLGRLPGDILIQRDKFHLLRADHDRRPAEPRPVAPLAVRGETASRGLRLRPSFWH
jgi:Protein of unknown function (DUF2905)